MEKGKLKLIIDHLELLINSLKEELKEETSDPIFTDKEWPEYKPQRIPLPLDDYDEIYDPRDEI